MTVRGGINPAPAPTFTIGPLSGVIEAAVLERWCAQAKPGETKLYATGPVLPRTSATVMLAREYAEAGLVHLKQKKCDGHGYEFLAERASAAGRVAALQRVRLVDDATDALRTELTRCADWQRPLPTNTALAKLCELAHANAVKYRLKRILNEGVFRLIDNGPNRLRGVARVSGAAGAK